MTTHKILWTALVLGGLAANVRTLSHAVRRMRRVRGSGRDGQLRVIAFQAARGEAVTLLVQCLLAALTAAAWYLDKPPYPEPRRLYLACGWALIACSVALAADSALDLRDRRRLFRMLGAATDGGGATSSHSGDGAGCGGA